MGCNNKLSLPNFKQYPKIYLEKLKETIKIQSQDSMCPTENENEHLANTDT
jgi:hypothetical protein